MNDETTEVKPITLEDEKGHVYTLEFNRSAVKFAESRGFVLDDVAKYPLTKITDLFYYAFYMHHRGITKEKTDELYKEIGKLPDGFLERLVQLYAVPLNTLMVGDEKNAKVTVTL